MKEKTRNRIQEEWGKPKNLFFHFDLISQYSQLSDDSSTQLDDKSVVDLDFHSFFKFVDRTNSCVGQQLLYHQLIEQKLNFEELDKQEEQVSGFEADIDNRLKCQAVLGKLSKANDYYFPYLMFSDLPDRLYPSWIIYILQGIMIIGIISMLKFPVAFFAILVVFIINLCLHYLHKSRIGNFTVYFSRLSNLSSTLRKLIPLNAIEESEKPKLLSDLSHIDKITSKILFLKTDHLQTSEIGSIFWFVFELIKILTLSEVTVFNSLVDKIQAARPQIINTYKAIGKIDISISIASLRAGLEYYSIPQFASRKKLLRIESLYHPLVTDCVPNDIELDQNSLLLTGSNMAGKSTFIKAVNLNALSSQTLNTSFSKDYESPIWQLKTSMAIKDNLDEKSSYYMEEVSSIGELLECSDDEHDLYLFTIDEIFKGTNTIERISSAKAILEYLNRGGHMVLVSTHDIELTKLLQNEFDLYYFQESILGESLSFDYKIKKGSLERSNAINILEIAGYPSSIVEEAKRLASHIQNEKTGYKLL